MLEGVFFFVGALCGFALYLAVVAGGPGLSVAVLMGLGALVFFSIGAVVVRRVPSVRAAKKTEGITLRMLLSFALDERQSVSERLRSSVAFACVAISLLLIGAAVVPVVLVWLQSR